MKIDGRLFLALIIVLALIPGEHADSLGGGVSVSSTDRGYAEGVTVAYDNAVVSQIEFTSSDVNYNNWLDDATGKHVEGTLKVVQGTGSYNFEFKRESTVIKPDSVNHLVSASRSISAKQQLTVDNAKEIEIKVEAENHDGNQAFMSTSVEVGSIKDYLGIAEATDLNVIASQKISRLSGDRIDISGCALGNDNLMMVGAISRFQEDIENVDLKSYASERASVSGSALINGVQVINEKKLKQIDEQKNSGETLSAFSIGKNGGLGTFYSSSTNIERPVLGSLMQLDTLKTIQDDGYSLFDPARRWRGDDPQIQFYLRDDQYLLDPKNTLTADSTKKAIESASESWDRATYADLFKSVKVITGKKLAEYPALNWDGKNVIAFVPFEDYWFDWVDNNWIGVTQHHLSYIPNTFDNPDYPTLIYLPILETDVGFNTRFPWTTGGGLGRDVETNALHEFGHVLGLVDRWGDENQYQVMFHANDGTPRRGLTWGDIEGVVRLYGPTQKPKKPCAGIDC